MRIDRLLGIVVYLLNRDVVNAKSLADRFEVSIRTIQRDIESLNLAGIPIVSYQGTHGGYGIVDSFKIDKQIITEEDFQNIKTALASICTAYDNNKLKETYEKILSSPKIGKNLKSKIKLDFSVSRENNSIDTYLKLIDRAINEKCLIKYQYTNSYKEKKERVVEPIGVVYKWYAWYMLAFCCSKGDYRLYKLARMRELVVLNNAFAQKHDSFDILLSAYEQQDSYNYLRVKALVKKEIRVSVEEYFPNAQLIELENGDLMLQFKAPENEMGWKGLLFMLSDKVKIIEPEILKQEFLMRAKEIINIYN